MPQQRMDIHMIKDILRLKYQGNLSLERIEGLGLARVGAELPGVDACGEGIGVLEGTLRHRKARLHVCSEVASAVPCDGEGADELPWVQAPELA